MTDRASRNCLSCIRQFLDEREIQREALVVAVSGGADSVALLRALHHWRQDLGLRLVAAHLDHGLRPESAADAAWVCELAHSLGVPVEVATPTGPVPSTGFEVWARNERYHFLQRVARSHQAPWVAVGHTADDQAETLLHHIMRGTGLVGLAGIPACRRLDAHTRLIRPSLEIRRATLREYLATLGQSFREDSTNSDSRWTRNQIRSELIPQLEERYNPHLIPALLSLSRQAGDASKLMRRMAIRLLRKSTLDSSPVQVKIRTELFTAAEEAVVRESAVQLWRRQRWPRQRMSFPHWSAVASLLRGIGPERLQWPGGITGVRRGGLVALERRST